jgi:hypothetical protein
MFCTCIIVVEEWAFAETILKQYSCSTLTYHKASLLMQYPRKYQAKKVMKFQVLKVESIDSTMSGSKSFRGSFMIPVTVEEWAFAETILKQYSCFRFLLRKNKTFTFKLFLQ